MASGLTDATFLSCTLKRALPLALAVITLDVPDKSAYPGINIESGV